MQLFPSLLFYILGFLVIDISNQSTTSNLESVDAQIKTLKVKIKDLVECDKNRNVLGQTWGNLAMTLQYKDVKFHSQGEYGSLKSSTLEAFEKALQYLDGGDRSSVKMQVILCNRMGMLLKMMGRGEEAVQSQRKVTILSNFSFDKAMGMYHQADALSMMGQLDQAIPLFFRALEIHPNGLLIYRSLVTALTEQDKYTINEWKTLLQEMQTKLIKLKNGGFAHLISEDKQAFLYRSPELDTSIYWAIFEVAAKVGELDLAWSYLEKGHQLKKANDPPFLPEASQLRTDSILNTFKQGFWPSPPVGLDSMVPVFIVGMMRSGSTLIETMLDAHRNIHGTGEESVFSLLTPNLKRDLVDALSTKHFYFGVKKVVERYANEILRQITEQSQRQMKQQSIDKHFLRVVDKMLFNYRNIGFIHLVFPNAVIIHTIRDPLDTLLSCYKHKFDDGGLE
eukprot:gene13597-28873_t